MFTKIAASKNSKTSTKIIIGLIIFVVLLTGSLLIRFLNIYGACIGVILYWFITSYAIYELTKHYKFRTIEQVLLFIGSAIVFCFSSVDIFSNSFFFDSLANTAGSGTPSIEPLPLFLEDLQFFTLTVITFWPTYIIFGFIILLHFALNRKMTFKAIKETIFLYVLILSIIFFAKFLFFINFYTYLLFLLLIFSTALSDVGAYFGGKLLGNKIFKRKLCPNVSPNKTIEGAIVGYVFSAIFILIWGFSLNLFQNYNYNQGTALIGVVWTLLLPLACILGDLFFSSIKRSLNIKDFSNLIPEHGGLLDRFDALMFSTWIVAIFIMTGIGWIS